MKDQLTGRFSETHGESKPTTPEYEAWSAMRKRCLNPKHRSFKNYGGRGITIHARWFGYGNFLTDMGRRPSPSYSLDRIDNDGNYEPENCRWATRSEQQQNKRIGLLFSSNTSGVAGVSWNSQMNKWEAYHWRQNRKIRLGYFRRFEAAVAARKTWEISR